VPRFKVGESIVLLPRYAHLYPSNSGIIVAVEVDSFREAFNDYTVAFPDGSTARILEFQVDTPRLEGDYFRR
jgi:hypothetical protein